MNKSFDNYFSLLKNKGVCLNAPVPVLIKAQFPEYAWDQHTYKVVGVRGLITSEKHTQAYKLHCHRV
jgi:hypothetical protein